MLPRKRSALRILTKLRAGPNLLVVSTHKYISAIPLLQWTGHWSWLGLEGYEARSFIPRPRPQYSSPGPEDCVLEVPQGQGLVIEDRLLHISGNSRQPQSTTIYTGSTFQRVIYKLNVTVHRCMQEKAPRYLVDCCTTVSEVPAVDNYAQSVDTTLLCRVADWARFGDGPTLQNF